MPKLPLFLIGAMFIVGAVMYPRLPDQIPVHWNISGEIDRWSDTSLLSVFQLPLMALGLYVLFMVMPYFDPKQRNVYRSRDLYFAALNVTTALFALIFVGSLAAAFDPSLPIDRLVMVGIGVMLIVIGNYMGRAKRNWTVGTRFSWTLADDEVWAKTNRLAGRLFMLAGLVSVACVFVPAPWNAIVMLSAVLATLPITYVYSMVLYKRKHPEEGRPPSGDDLVDAE